MRTITTTYNVYSFAELSEDAKQKALENLWDINADYNWWENVYEDAENIRLKLTGFDLERRNITGEFITSAPEVVETILAQHGESCETYKTALKYKNSFQLASDETDEQELEESEDELLNELLQDYIILLQQDYDYRTSEEAIKETIEANEYEFTEDGKLS